MDGGYISVAVRRLRGVRKRWFFVILCSVVTGFGLWFTETYGGGQDISAQVGERNEEGEISVKSGKHEPVNRAEAARDIANLNMPFILNEGQSDERVKFYADTFSGTVFVTKSGEIIYSIPKVEDYKPVNGLVLKEEIVGGKVDEVKGEGEVGAKVSYFKGNISSDWKSNIPTYDIVGLGEVYRGVELKLKAYGDNVEKLFYIKPGAESGNIKVKLSGGELSVNKHGELEVETELGTIKFTKPVAYQENEGNKEFIEVAYVVSGDEYGFKLGEYSREREVVIDPLLASTFLGGSGFFEGGFGIALDNRGDVYVAGRTYASNFPGVDSESADRVFSGQEVFIAKLDSGLSTIMAATFLGGSDNDNEQCFGIAIDGTDNVYVTGTTSASNFPGIGAGSADSSFAGGSEGFVVKLNSGLSRILGATYLGGSGSDSGNAINIDGAGNIYVAGNTSSSDFPGIRAGSADRVFDELGEGFLVKLNSSLSTIISGTYLGGDDFDSVSAIALDSVTGNVYAGGETYSTDFPGVVGGSADRVSDGDEGFVAMLNSNLSSILSATYLGGNGSFEEVYSIAVESVGGDLYVAGRTSSSNFPGAGAGSADRAFTGGQEGFVAKLSSNLGAIISGTYLGGSGFDTARAIAIDGRGNIYVAGSTNSANFPGVGAESEDSTFGETEAFVSKLDSGLSTIISSTFLGGSVFDGGLAIALDSGGNVYISGSTSSSDFPGVGAGSADSIFSRGFEAFVAKLNLPSEAPSPSPSPTPSPPPGVVCGGRAPTNGCTVNGVPNRLCIGTNGNDTVIGTGGQDVIHGLSGSDTINGLGGDDIICGGAGDDTINGGGGADRVFGRDGRDTLNGNTGNDRLNGGNGNDRLNGGFGGDTLNGDAGSDTLNGGFGNDMLNGDFGGDVLNGDVGFDILKGGPGSDTLNGGFGDDSLNGGTATDTCDGGAHISRDTAVNCETVVNIP